MANYTPINPEWPNVENLGPVYFIHLSDRDIFSATYGNWDKNALKSRLNSNRNIKIEKIKLVSPDKLLNDYRWGETTENQHAQIWLRLSPVIRNTKSTNEKKKFISEIADNSPFSQPTVYALRTVEEIGKIPGYEEPGSGTSKEFFDLNLGDNIKPLPPWLKVSVVVTAVGILLRGLNN